MRRGGVKKSFVVSGHEGEGQASQCEKGWKGRGGTKLGLTGPASAALALHLLFVPPQLEIAPMGSATKTFLPPSIPPLCSFR